ncbi:hypothetical protein [Pseudoroseomonas sp. WGS1072]|uniref:hypothetical protein n=1 Tax=Roseomonas sp. WGS1072 TaxID=3366816 RepID=UPI003BF253A2
MTRIEGDMPANAATLSAIRAALEAAGIEFIPENGGGAGVRLVRATPAEDPSGRPDFASTIGTALDRLKPDDD